MPSVLGIGALALAASLAPAIDQFAAGDLSAARHLGLRVESSVLASALVDPASLTRRTATFVAAGVEDGWPLLGPLAKRARGWDRRDAASAAASARAIARRLPAREVADHPEDDALASLAQAWLEVAQTPGIWPDVRVAGLEIATALASARGEDGPGFVPDAFFGDGEPEVRRAALELLPAPLPAPWRPAVVRRLLEDPDASVALAAAQVLCGDLRDVAAPPVTEVLGAIGPNGMDRIRALVAPALPPAPTDDRDPSRIDAARCLHAAGDPDDRAALRVLGKRVDRDARAILDAWEADR